MIVVVRVIVVMRLVGVIAVVRMVGVIVVVRVIVVMRLVGVIVVVRVVVVMRLVGVIIMVVIVIGVHFVHDLNRCRRRKHETVHYAPGRSQHAHHVIGKVVVGRPASLAEPVFSDEAVTQPQTGLRGRNCPENRFQRRVPQPAFGQLRAVQIEVARIRPNNPETPEPVPQCHRDDLLDHRVLVEKLDLFRGDVADRRVDMEHRREHQLHGAALRADHHVDGVGVRGEPLLELLDRNHQQGDGRCPQAKQRDVQRGTQWTKPNPGPCQAPSTHELPPLPRTKRCANLSRTRPSWVVITRVEPRRSASCARRSATVSAFRSSKLAVGSSASRIFGSTTSARASATRCASPTLSSPGRVRANASTPSRRSVVLTISSPKSNPANRRAKPRFCVTLRA